MRSPKDLVIVGAGGFGREVLDVVDALGWRDRFAGFADDREVELELLEARSASSLGSTDDLGRDVRVVIAIGDGAAREAVAKRLAERGVGFAEPLIHPAAVTGSEVRLREGSVLCANAVITTNVEVGQHVHVNLNATVGHDCTVGDYVTINPGANISGNVHLGDRVTVGTGAAVLQGVEVGSDAFVGAGAVVVKDVPSGTTVVGVPARPLSRS